MNTTQSTKVAIIGAGPYGLSISAHLSKYGVAHRIFGTPMASWQSHMPKGMYLKSDGFASSLFDPDRSYTLGRHCIENGLPYDEVGLPVPLETFVEYGLEFQRRLVPRLEPVNITEVQQKDSGYMLTTESGETLHADKVVVAAGITHFAFLPPSLQNLPDQYVSHSSQHSSPDRWVGKRVLVVGGGSSAVDMTAMLKDGGADVELVARRATLAFHSPSKEPRSLLQRVKAPRSGLGLGWRSRFCTDMPLLFHTMPEKFRIKVVQKHLGPSPGWFVRDKVVGKVPLHMSHTPLKTTVSGNEVQMEVRKDDGSINTLVADHIIGATGYRVSLRKLNFLSEDLRNRIESTQDTPVLNSNFESTVQGLYMVGLASANSFGPLTRFAYGAQFTAERLSKHLAKK